MPWEWVSAPETLLLVLLILLDLTQHSPGIYQHLHLANTCLLMPPAALEEEPGPRPGGGGGVGAPMLAMSSECLLCAPRVVPPPSEWAWPSHLQVRAIPPHPRKCAPSFREEKPLVGGLPLLTRVGLGGRGLGLTLGEAGQHGREVQEEQLHLGVPNKPQSHPSPCPVPTPNAARAGSGRDPLKDSNVGGSGFFKAQSASQTIP